MRAGPAGRNPQAPRRRLPPSAGFQVIPAGCDRICHRGDGQWTGRGWWDRGTDNRVARNQGACRPAGEMELNRFSRALSDYCREQPLREKWLVAPSLRVGFQWLDRVARAGRPVLNVRVTTLSHLALELAAPRMEREGVKYLRGVRAEVLAGEVFGRLKGEGAGYLSGLTPTPGFARSLLRAIRDLRLAGLAAKDLMDPAFEVEAKGREIRALLAEYERELRTGRLFDYADVLRTAVGRLQESAATPFSGRSVLLPGDEEEQLRGLERGLWMAIPAGNREVLAVDLPAELPEGEITDASLLRWVTSPVDAPAPVGDGTARVFRAVGEVNEVREVLRRCVEERIPYDEVEILHTDWDTYVPLVYELAWRLQSSSGDSIPVTFSEGIPPRYSRPARALMGWLSWIREDCPQSTLVRLIQDGLLRLPGAGHEGPSHTRLAAVLRSLPVGKGADRYQEVIDREIASLEVRLRALGDLRRKHDGHDPPRPGQTGSPAGGGGPGQAGTRGNRSDRVRQGGSGEGDADVATGVLTITVPCRDVPQPGGFNETGEGDLEGRILTGPGPVGREEGEAGGDPRDPRVKAIRLRERARALRAIRALVAELRECAGWKTGGPDARDLLRGSLRFLEGSARRAGELDEYVCQQLAGKIRELAEALGEDEVPGFDAFEWLADLPAASRVLGMGPRPGCLHVAHVDGGGHSGRKHTFILGLDDTRFPGTGAQDPLLLDRERDRISGELPTASSRLTRRLAGFGGLLARLRGTVTLGASCRNLADDREMFPSPVILAAYRILSGNREGDPQALREWLPEPASFAPAAPDRCVDATEWWLWRLCASGEVEDPEGFVGRHFPHLGRGLRARQARRSDRFTEYDGYVPQAGRDADPARAGGPVLSASRLERLGSCPLEYFFQYVLGIERPEEYEIDSVLWLDPTEKGELLHRVFRGFMSALNRKGLLPELGRDRGLLAEILESEIELWKREKPPPGPDVFDREVRELQQTARIFLQEEEEFCRASRPLFFEVSVGLPAEGEGSRLDSPEPVEVELPDGRTIRVRGRIDRVDEEAGPGTGKHYAVWDYKTGSSWKYRDEKGRKNPDPFRQGRLVQGALYLAMAEARLRKEVSPGARVSRFGYFFPRPGPREHGERLDWSREELARGGRVVAGLCEMLARGTFPFTDDPGDTSNSDYTDAFGDAAEAASAAKRKLANPENRELRPMQALRGYVSGGDVEEGPGGTGG